ncbi:MAG: hypothetical protein ACP5NF_06000 [Thermoanaerobaculum sp.]
MKRARMLFLLVWIGLRAQTVQGQGNLLVTITDDAGKEVRDQARYVALVRQNDLIKEVEVPAGEPVPPFDPEPGLYTLVCTAEGYSFRAMPIAIPEGKGTREQCRLSRLVGLRGRSSTPPPANPWPTLASKTRP